MTTGRAAPVYEIRPATLTDVRAMARLMRTMDRAEIEGWGVPTRGTLRKLWRGSPVCRAAVVDGEIAALWGCQGATLSGDAAPWLFTTDAMSRARLAFFRETRREITEMLGTHRRLRSYVLASYDASIRFFGRMGFAFGPEEAVGVNGTAYRMMTLERPKPDRRPFIIYALPRSRTFWLSRFLSYGDWEGWHEPGCRFRGVEDIRSWLAQDCTGAADTLALPWWRLAQRYRPDARILIVRRPVAEVVDSLMRLDMRGVCAFDRAMLTKQMTRLDRKLDQIAARVSGALSVQYTDLSDEKTCARVFEHCLPYEHDHDWWERNDATNLQADMPALMRYKAGHDPQLRRLAALCREESIRSIRENSRPPDRSAITIQEEKFDDFWRDGQALFAAHAAEAGGRDGVTLDLNVPLAADLEARSAAQIITARHQGRMVGYVISVIGPSLEDKSLVVANQMPIFVVREFRGIGGRLERFSIDALRSRGVDEVFFRAGVRADGPRLGAMYLRLGAAPYGEIYRLSLKVA
jgi:hypothetical protein